MTPVGSGTAQNLVAPFTAQTVSAMSSHLPASAGTGVGTGAILESVFESTAPGPAPGAPISGPLRNGPRTTPPNGIAPTSPAIVQAPYGAIHALPSMPPPDLHFANRQPVGPAEMSLQPANSSARVAPQPQPPPLAQQRFPQVSMAGNNPLKRKAEPGAALPIAGVVSTTRAEVIPGHNVTTASLPPSSSVPPARIAAPPNGCVRSATAVLASGPALSSAPEQNARFIANVSQTELLR